ncbi:MAG: peptidase M22 [Verrucomicrobiota bacterium]
MPSLRQLLAAHPPLLLIDAASARVQVGWLEEATSRWASAEEESGIAVFRCLEQLGRRVEEAGAFVFCDGPGSILGIRTVAMALRTWSVLQARPIFAYSGLAVVAHALSRPEVTVIADARRDAWHCYRRTDGLRRLPTGSLPGDLVMPDGFRHWTPLPPTVARTSYDLATLLPQILDQDLFLPTEAPDAFLHEEPSYVTWTPQVHRAPVSPR